MSLEAVDALSAALQAEAKMKRPKDPSRVLVRVTGTAKGWTGAVGLLSTAGSGVEFAKVTLDHLDDAAAWKALLDEIRGGALRIVPSDAGPSSRTRTEVNELVLGRRS